MKQRIAVLGAGGWGTALAVLLSEKNYPVTLWENFPDYAGILIKNRENKKFLPGVHIPETIKITSDITMAVENSPVIILAVPSHVARDILNRIKNNNISSGIFVSVIKGIENKTLKRISEIVKEILGNVKFAVLSGPSHAEEVSRKMPTAVVAASKDISTAKYVQNLFCTPYFRVYTSKDIIGVEYGGALKNIIAIAAGIVDGLSFGDNTKAALMTRGLVEISRLGVKMGADSFTFAGLSGIGDLIVTCGSKHSRNRAVGAQIGSGKTLKTVLSHMEMVAEGVKTAKSAYELSRKYKVDMPITEAVYKVLFKNKDPKKAVYSLMTRSYKSEI